MKITPTSMKIVSLLGTDNEQYVIPSYQRRYSWQERQLWELIEDIDLIENTDNHLLGTIVCLVDQYSGALNTLELVDGQQRITTLCILFECIRQRYEELGDAESAKETTRLLYAKPRDGTPIRRIKLDSLDAQEFDLLVHGDESHKFKNDRLVSAFKLVRRWVAGKDKEKLDEFLYHLKNDTTVVRLEVGNAKDAFKLFETINNRGLRLSSTDIIKNFLLGNAARFGESALDAARKSWTLLIQHLDGTNHDAFFRYYLMMLTNVRLTDSEVVAGFKKLFMERVAEAENLPERHLYSDGKEEDEAASEDEMDDPDAATEVSRSGDIAFDEFLERLVESAKAYGQIVLARTGDSRTDRSLVNLRKIKAAQTYGYLMHLRLGGCSEKVFQQIMKMTEGFVLRRHICRERANETESLFARLCKVDARDPIMATKKAYRDLCPSDKKFEDEFAIAAFPSSLIDRARYCLEQIELRKHGVHDEIQVLGPQDVHVEHIIPKKIVTKKAKKEFGNWVEYLGNGAADQHPKYVSRIGNLTLFAGELNIGASNNPFRRKTEAYRKSAIRITQELASLPSFKFSRVEQRSRALASEAVAIWPMP